MSCTSISTSRLPPALWVAVLLFAPSAFAADQRLSYGDSYSPTYQRNLLEDGFKFYGSAGDVVEITAEGACVNEHSGVGLTWDPEGSILGEWLVDTRMGANPKVHRWSDNSVTLRVPLPASAEYRAWLFLDCEEGSRLTVTLQKEHQVHGTFRMALSALGIGAVGPSFGYTPGVAFGFGAQLTPRFGLEGVVTANVVATSPLAAFGMVGAGARLGPKEIFVIASVGFPATFGPTSTIGGLGGRVDLQIAPGEFDTNKYFLFGEVHSYSLTEPEAFVLGGGYAF